MMSSAIALYDIGMISVPESILYKKESISADEFSIIRKHTYAGQIVLKNARSNIVYHSKFFALADDMVHYHHEKWDGTGYPEQLSGSQIPLTARILCVCDCYDAITRETAYSEAIPHIQAVEIMVKEREKHFDPAILDAFLAIHAKFQEVATMYAN
jgi:putative two-component system response regulator